MACRGVLFAISDVTVAALLAAKSDEDVMEIVESIEEDWDEQFLAETDKAWDAMHRAQSDGSLNPEGGSFPTNRAILGGKHLYRGDEYIVALVTRDEVPAVARALASIDDAEMQRRYEQLVPRDYAAEYGDGDREYTVEYFRAVAELYDRAAKAGRPDSETYRGGRDVAGEPGRDGDLGGGVPDRRCGARRGPPGPGGAGDAGCGCSASVNAASRPTSATRSS
jgi:hypothetical protein